MIDSILRPKSILGTLCAAASLAAIALTTIGRSTKSAEAGAEYLRKLTFDNAGYNPINTRWSGCANYDFYGIRLFSPDIPNQLGLATVKKGANNSQGNFVGGHTWIAGNVSYPNNTGKSLALSFPSTTIQCTGQKEEQRIVEQNSRVVPGISTTPYVYQFGHARYTGFAVKFGNTNGNNGKNGFQSPQGTTRNPSDRSLVCQWWQQTGLGKRPPLALYVYAHPGNSNKLDYEVISYANAANGSDVGNVIFTGTVVKNTWHRMLFYTVFRPNTSANAPLGTVGFWLNGTQQMVAPNSGDAIITNNDRWWQNHIGWTEGGFNNTSFSVAIYRWAQARSQVVYFDNIAVTRMTNNQAGGAAFNLADPANF